MGESTEIWDAFGMKAAKSFGILVGDIGVGRVIVVNGQGATSRFGTPLGWIALSALES
jgi:hypothetical protein